MLKKIEKIFNNNCGCFCFFNNTGNSQSEIVAEDVLQRSKSIEDLIVEDIKNADPFNSPLRRVRAFNIKLGILPDTGYDSQSNKI